MIEIHFCSERNDSIPMRTFARALAPAVCLLLVVSEAFAQRGGNDWMTIGNDAQRSNWVRSDGKISVASINKNPTIPRPCPSQLPGLGIPCQVRKA